MLNFLNSDKLLLSLVLIIILTLIVLFFVYKGFRWFILTILAVVFLGFTTYAGFQINNYYNKSGGIFGAIEDLVKPNSAEPVTSLKIQLKNIVLTETEDGKHFSAVIQSDSVLNLTENTKYYVVVNGTPLHFLSGAVDYCSSVYNAKFYDETLNSTYIDDLSIGIFFYNNATTFLLKTDGGSEAVKYWDYYFNMNSFVIEVLPAENESYIDYTNNNFDDFINNQDFNFVEFLDINGVQIKELAILDNMFITTSVYAPFISGKEFVGWSINGVDIVDYKGFEVVENITFKPIYKNETYIVNYYNYSDNTLIDSKTFEHGDLFDLSVGVSDNSNGLYFWYYEDGLKVNSTDKVYSNTNIFLKKSGGIF